MSWSMPPRILQAVAALLALVALTAFTLGIINAPQRGRLPGEPAGGGSSAAAAIEAPDATPLSQERIEGPPRAPDLTPEEKAAQEAARDAKADVDAAKPTAVQSPAAQAANPTPALQVPEPAPSPADEAPH